jgi:hypothetical protein
VNTLVAKQALKIIKDIAVEYAAAVALVKPMILMRGGFVTWHRMAHVILITRVKQIIKISRDIALEYVIAEIIAKPQIHLLIVIAQADSVILQTH